VWQRPNLLLMDEPTNHLDLTTREALSMALNEFEGTVMLVSHDRALLRETCDEFWLVAKGLVQPFDGDLDDYQKWLLDVSRATARGQPIPDPPKAAGAPVPELPAAASTGTKAGAGKGSTPASGGVSPPRDDRKDAARSRSLIANKTRPLRMELAQIDARMEKLGSEKAELEGQLSAGKRSPNAIAETGRRLAHIGAEVATLEERWLELQGEIEAINVAG
jgi:ATP-binding cassette subfamily F protein 3